MARPETSALTAVNDGIRLDEPSVSMRRRWAKKLASGKTKTFIVYVGGQWSCSVQRGNKRNMRINLG